MQEKKEGGVELKGAAAVASPAAPSTPAADVTAAATITVTSTAAATTSTPPSPPTSTATAATATTTATPSKPASAPGPSSPIASAISGSSLLTPIKKTEESISKRSLRRPSLAPDSEGGSGGSGGGGGGGPGVSGRNRSSSFLSALTGTRSRSNTMTTTSNGRVALSDFDHLRVIGKGAFGIVHAFGLKAERKAEKRRIYAAKFMAKALVIDGKNVDLVMNERNILAIIKHPFVCEMFWCFQTPRDIIIVLEFLGGGDLQYHMVKDSKWRITEKDLPFYAGQLLLALDYLRLNNIIHRDIKPANIMLDEHGNCRITDFGLATVLLPGRRLSQCCGTIDYMAPEVARGTNYDTLVDVWSVGASLYHLYFRRIPFHNQYKSTDDFLTMMMAKDPAPSPSSRIAYPSNVSADIVSFFKDMLNDDVSARKSSEELQKSNIFTAVNFDFGACAGRRLLPPFVPPPFANVDPLLEVQYQLEGEERHRSLQDSEQSLFASWDYDFCVSELPKVKVAAVATTTSTAATATSTTTTTEAATTTTEQPEGTSVKEGDKESAAE